MPLNAELPPEGSGSWFAPFKAAWDAMTSFVNGLESSLSKKVNVSTYTSGMADKLSADDAAELDVAGWGRVIFIESGAEIPADTPPYTIVIELEAP